MRINYLVALLTAGTVAVLGLSQAHAGLLININKSVQRMTVNADGKRVHNWPVSTGKRGYDTPSGRFSPFRMEIDHYSKE